MTSLQQKHIQEFECRNQSIEKVTVFDDRAEVKRHIDIELQPGVTEIHLKNISQAYYPDSLRVDGRGDALIHEVKLIEKAVLDIESDSPKMAQLRRSVQEQKKVIRELKEQEEFCKKKAKSLDLLIKQSGHKLIPPEIKDLQSQFLDNIVRLYEFYDEESEKTRTQLTRLAEELENAENELKKREKNFQNAKTDALNSSTIKIFVITLESKAGGKIELDVTYQVVSASWTPSYDIRVDAVTTPPTMKLTYYGLIRQMTGEDWLEASIILSTAQPSLGGNIPELPTLEASFYREERRVKRSLLSMPNMARKVAPEGLSDDEELAGRGFGYGLVEQREQTLSTEFIISRPGFVPSGPEDHKVTIGIIDLKPQLFYETVPKISTSVFLAASILNESSLPLLAGEGSVFLNNSFVSKVCLTAVSPGERFICSLGVDQAIKVTYKPKKEFREKSGMISKTSTISTEQVINIRNTRQTDVLLTVKEQIPRSTEEKLKVKVINPAEIVVEDKEVTNVAQEFQLPQPGVKQNKQNNLEWTVKMKPGEVVDLLVKYSIEHPSNQTLELKENN